MKWLLIGVGNPLRSDDGVGQRVAEIIADLGWPGVEVRSLPQLTPELAEEVSAAEGVIVVDAALGLEPGQVAVCRLGVSCDTSPLSHHLDPGELLALAEVLYGRCPAAWALRIGAESFAVGMELSAPVTAAVPGVLTRVAELVECGRNPAWWQMSEAGFFAPKGRNNIAQGNALGTRT